MARTGIKTQRLQFKKQRAFKLFPDLNYDRNSDNYFTCVTIGKRLGVSGNLINTWHKEWQCLTV